MVSKTLFISRAGQQYGPITEDEFRRLVELGHLKEDDLVWSEGAIEWMSPASFLDRGTAGAATPPTLSVAQGPQDAAREAAGQTPTRKSWINGSTIFLGLVVLVIVGITVAEPESIPYRLAGAINGAIFGAIGGALAALLQYLIRKKFTVAPVGIAVVFGFKWVSPSLTGLVRSARFCWFSDDGAVGRRPD